MLIQVAIKIWIKHLPECLYQQEADFPLTSRDLQKKSVPGNIELGKSGAGEFVLKC